MTKITNMVDNTLKRNYHTHTFRCKHAKGDCIDYALAARDRGMEALGFSDHTPLPDNRWPEVRMDLSELDHYDNAIRHAQEMVPELTILKGMECEFTPEYAAFYQDELLGARSYDYLVGAVHFIEIDNQWVSVYADRSGDKALAAYEKLMLATINSGLFAFIAHPDFFGISTFNWTPRCNQLAHTICQAAVEAKIPLELNGYGTRKKGVEGQSGLRPPYPWLSFWEVASEYPVEVIFNSDAHRPEDVGHGLEELTAIAERFQLNQVELAISPS